MDLGFSVPGINDENPTGVGHHTRSLYRALEELNTDHGLHPLDLQGILSGSVPSWSSIPGLRTMDRLLADHLLAGLEARRRNLDLLHCPKSVIPLGFNGTRTLTIHDVIFLDHPEYYSLRERSYWWAATRLSLNLADGVVAVSEATASRLVAHFDRTDFDLTVIPNGVDPDHFQPTPTSSDDTVRTSYDLDEPFHLYVGSTMRRKNLNRLLRAYTRASERYESLPSLILAGPPPGDDHPIRETLRRENLTDRVHLLGYVSNRELPALYRQARALVYPSLAEGFGLPVLQALACRCPVICSDLMELREVGGDQPSYFNPRSVDSILKSLDPKQPPRDVPESVRQEIIHQYSWDQVAREYLTYFERIVNE